MDPDNPGPRYEMRLEFEVGAVRDWSEGDKGDLVEFANNRKVWRNMAHRFPHPYTRAEADAWISLLKSANPATHWAIEADGRAVGGIGIDIRDGIYSKTAEFGYWIGEPYWNRGIATGAAKAVVTEVFRRFDLERLEAHVFEWNPASMRVLEKAGFEREGLLRRSLFKDGCVIDQMLYALIARDAE